MALELRGVLHIPDPAATREKRILVYDDVYTTGLCAITEGRDL